MFKLLNTATATTESFMVQNGKIYLVMTIVSIILIGLFIYVSSVDKKLTQLEKK